MSYKALYRTYRPQTFDEVAGQQHIVKTLKNALANNKIAHAYLFAGPRGTGKTSMAKLFAKALNCDEGIGHQCNKCPNCLDIIEGNHPDVIEIDAASNNGVDQVRDLIDTVNYLPIKGKYKVYIIDEVHMMTPSAFNALLKTLEEPPENVVFILATTEPHTILPTILSRCQRYDFNKVNDGDLKERLIYILNNEHIEYTDEALNAVISLADGGVRDALSILDQILAYSGNNLDEEDVYALFGLTSIDQKVHFLKLIYHFDVAQSLDLLNSFAQAGVDFKRLNSDLLDVLKDILVYKRTNEAEQLANLKEGVAEELAQEFDVAALNEMISTFLKAQTDFRTASNIKTIFEVNVLKLCTRDETIKGIIKEVSKEPKKPVETPVIFKKEEPKPIIKEEAKEEVPPVKEEPILEVKKEEPKVEPKKEKISEAPSWLFDEGEVTNTKLESEGDSYELNDDLIIKLMVIGDKVERKKLGERYGELNYYMADPNIGHMVSLLKDGKPYILTKDILVIKYDLGSQAKKANIKANQKVLSSIVSKMLGREIYVYAISQSDHVRIYHSFTDLNQINALPEKAEININVKEIFK